MADYVPHLSPPPFPTYVAHEAAAASDLNKIKISSVLNLVDRPVVRWPDQSDFGLFGRVANRPRWAACAGPGWCVGM